MWSGGTLDHLNGFPDDIVGQIVEPKPFIDSGTKPFTYWEAMSTYHPQENDQAEKTNQVLKQYLCYLNFAQDDSVLLLTLPEFS